MTEYDLFAAYLPEIVEMVNLCRRLDKAEFEEWKQDTMEHCPEMVKGLVGKVLGAIDSVVLSVSVA